MEQRRHHRRFGRIASLAAVLFGFWLAPAPARATDPSPTYATLTLQSWIQLGIWTTATRPASPQQGWCGFNNTTSLMECWAGLSWVSASGAAGALLAANNLSDVASVGAARTNLGLGSAALLASSAFLQPSNNLSDVASTTTARTNLGLGTAATMAASAGGTIVASVSGAFTAGDLIESNDTAGTSVDSGVPASWFGVQEFSANAVWAASTPVVADTVIIIPSFDWLTGACASISYAVKSSGSPSFNATLTHNGAAVTGCTSIAVTSGTTATTACTGLTLAVGEQLAVVTGSPVNSPANAFVKANCTHSRN